MSTQFKLHPEKSIKQHQFMFNSFPAVSYVTSQIMLPFPPNISANEIVDKRRKDQIMLKSPNAFMIYRMSFLDHLTSLNRNFKMTDVSKLVSTYWRNEPDTVKDAYKKIAHEVEQELNERRKKNILFCKVSWKDSKLFERKQNYKSSKSRSLKKKRKRQPNNNNENSTKLDETLTFEYPNNFEFIPFNYGGGTTSFNTSLNDINNSLTHETQINSINNDNPNLGYEFINYFEDNIIKFDEVNNCTDYLNFEYDNNNMIDYYL
ncbi:hypothetical protein Glove_306g64 [Diversispora epigaea]|uniref:HMG box domain-containing protein n=1 Tax=Diversispora epigaea TaxID=1348612 RepID=A0A397HTV0_9GLOM|nr:hypothetical protein Glove_306g64 [Diversispora epigaea]